MASPWNLGYDLRVAQDHWKWCRRIHHIQLSIISHYNYGSILCHFWVIWHWIICPALETWVRGHSRLLKMVPFDSLLFTFCSDYGSILYHFRDKARYWPKLQFFHMPSALNATIRGREYPSDYCHTVWCGKTRMVWLPNSLMIRLAISIEYRYVTDRRMDRHLAIAVCAMHSITQ